jgi:hypothetical protein
MDSYERLINTLQEFTVDLIPIKDCEQGTIEFNSREQFNDDRFRETRFDDRFRPLIKQEEDLLKKIHNDEIDLMKSKFYLFLKFYLSSFFFIFFQSLKLVILT